MIDTHSHLDDPQYSEDLPDVIKRAKEAGIESIFVPSVNLTDLPRVFDICNQYPDYLHPMVGLHPEEVHEDYKEVLEQMYSILKRHLSEPNPPIAIGEIGLDFYFDDTYKEQQLDAFEIQIQWAIEHDLPLMLHVRKASNEAIQILERHRNDNLRGVFHCFSASKEIAQRYLSFPNFMLGIGGILTFKNSNLPEVLKTTVPLSRIVLETDAPYLAPTPHRGKRNESCFIPHIAERLSEIYDCDVKKISIETNKNCNIFR